MTDKTVMKSVAGWIYCADGSIHICVEYVNEPTERQIEWVERRTMMRLVRTQRRIVESKCGPHRGVVTLSTIVQEHKEL